MFKNFFEGEEGGTTIDWLIFVGAIAGLVVFVLYARGTWVTKVPFPQ